MYSKSIQCKSSTSNPSQSKRLSVLWERVLRVCKHWRITYFPRSCSSLVESCYPSNKEQGLCHWLVIKLVRSRHIRATSWRETLKRRKESTTFSKKGFVRFLKIQTWSTYSLGRGALKKRNEIKTFFPFLKIQTWSTYSLGRCVEEKRWN